MIPLLLAHWKNALLVAAALTVFGMWRSREHALVERGKALERVRVADSALAVIVPERIKVETLTVHDIRTVTRTIARVDSLRDTLLTHITDTLIVKEYVTRTDSALRACSALSNDCAEYRRLTTLELTNLRTKLAAQPMVVAKSCAMPNVIAAMAGAGIVWLVKR